MNKLKNSSFVLLSLLVALLFATAADAKKPSKQLVKDVRLAGKVIKKTEGNLTTTINANNALVPELRATGKCAAAIITDSPGWDFNSKPSKAEYGQTNGAYLFAYQAAVGKTAVDVLQASHWAEGTLRSTAKYRVQSKTVKNVLKSHAELAKGLRLAGQKEVDVCAVLDNWKSAGYSGIYNLVNAEWGENALQEMTKEVNDAYRKIFKNNNKIYKAGANANSLWADIYARATRAFYSDFWWEEGDLNKNHLKRLLG